MSDLFPDATWASLNKAGETLCGDHVEFARSDDDARIAVLADGMGSGVKASILSTLTAKILSTMLSQGMTIEEAIDSLLRTLPICEERKVAYSTFTIAIMRKAGNTTLIEYDNPKAMLLRDGAPFALERETVIVQNKTLQVSEWTPKENDLLLFYSDGVIHASVGDRLNLNWDIPQIEQYMSFMYMPDYDVQTLVDILLNQCNSLYDGKPGDDTTVCGVLYRKRCRLNMMIGPPFDPADDDSVIRDFLRADGMHVLSGGTTADLVAKHLGKTITCDPFDLESDVPPVCYLDGIDLVTEGVVTLSHVVQTIREAVEKRNGPLQPLRDNAAGKLTRLLVNATDINLFVGSAVNVAHQNQGESFTFSFKMKQMEELKDLLVKLGKNVNLRYC